MAHQYQNTTVRQRQIAEAALEVISEEGLRSFTTRAIAQKVGITDGTIFRHFPNKKAIVIAALKVLEELIFTPPTAEESSDPLLQLKIFFVHRAQLIAGPRSIGRLAFSEQLIFAADEEGRAMVASWRKRNLMMIKTLLDRIRADGRLRDDLPITALSMLLLGQLLTLHFERSSLNTALPNLDQRIALAWDTLQTVLLSPKQP